MLNENSKTALLFFSRSPEEEVKAKALLPKRQAQHGIVLARQLIRNTLQVLRQTGLPIFTCYSPEQRGHHFGERLANALEAIFAIGYERVVVVGNDTPGLSVRHLREAESALQHQPFVWGAAADGGVFLLGMHRHAFQRDAFEALPWETPLLCQALQLLAEADFGIAALEYDLDNAADFQQLLARLVRGSRLWHLFHQWVVEKQPSMPMCNGLMVSMLYFNALYSRGPPLFAFHASRKN